MTKSSLTRLLTKYNLLRPKVKFVPLSSSDLEEDHPARMADTVIRAKVCQYPVGEISAGDEWKCGKSVKEFSTYCQRHHELCWFTPQKPRELRRYIKSI